MITSKHWSPSWVLRLSGAAHFKYWHWEKYCVMFFNHLNKMQTQTLNDMQLDQTDFICWLSVRHWNFIQKCKIFVPEDLEYHAIQKDYSMLSCSHMWDIVLPSQYSCYCEWKSCMHGWWGGNWLNKIRLITDEVIQKSVHSLCALQI